MMISTIVCIIKILLKYYKIYLVFSKKRIKNELQLIHKINLFRLR
jgi:hypothetical protein